MPDQDDKNDSLQRMLGDALKPVQEALGALRRMLWPPHTSYKPSSLTRTASESPFQNGNGYVGTRTNLAGSPNSFLTLHHTESDSSSKNTPSPEREHEIGFTVHIRTFGSLDHIEDSITRSLALALHRTFRDDSRWTLFDEKGRQVIFDSYAHDGEHDGHDVVIVKKP